jgi:hypothetical protein
MLRQTVLVETVVNDMSTDGDFKISLSVNNFSTFNNVLDETVLNKHD